MCMACWSKLMSWFSVNCQTLHNFLTFFHRMSDHMQNDPFIYQNLSDKRVNSINIRHGMVIMLLVGKWLAIRTAKGWKSFQNFWIFFSFGKNLYICSNIWKVSRNSPEMSAPLKPTCHCNEMGNTILPINQVWKHIYSIEFALHSTIF